MSLLALREAVIAVGAPRPSRRTTPKVASVRVLGVRVRPGSPAERGLLFFDRHRFWFYVAATVGLLAVIVLSSAQRAWAIDASAVPSPGNFYCALDKSGCDPANGVSKYGSLQEACRYLTFCRWQEVNSVSSPQISASNGLTAIPAVGMTVIARLLLTLASVVMFVVGFLLVQAMQINVIDQVAVTVDYIFASVGSTLMWGDVTESPLHALGAFSTIIVLVVLYAIFLSVNPWSRRSPRHVVMLLVRALAGIVLFAAMTHAAMENHSSFGTAEKSKIGEIDESGSIINSKAISKNALNGTGASPGEMSSWSPLSPGWFIAGMHGFSQIVVSAISSLTTGMTNAAGTGVVGTNDASTGCGAYISAMHTLYKQAPPSAAYRAGSADVLVKYDELMGALYFTPYRMAAYGDSVGGQNAWCRIAEQQVGAPVGDQVLISQQAGLYKEVTGAVAEDKGAWKGDASETVARASNFFGPNFLDASARRRAQNYFAACIWAPNGGVAVNETDDWNSVLKFNDPDDSEAGPTLWGWSPFAKGIEGWKDLFASDSSKLITKETCQGVVNSQDGFINPAAGTESTDGASGNAYPSYPFNYREYSGNSGVFSVLGMGDSSSLPYFAGANTIAGGNSGAYDYYSNSAGLNSGWAAILGLMAAAFAVMVGKYILPFILGGLIAQFVELSAMVLLVFVAFLYIIPIRHTRDLVVMTAKTVGWAFLVNAVFIGALSVMLVLTNISRELLYSQGAPAFVALMQLAGSTLLAFIATKMVLRRVLGFDTHSLAAATRSASKMSMQSVGARLGVSEPAPHLFREWRGVAGGATGKLLKESRDEARSHIRAAQAATPGGAVRASADAVASIVKRNRHGKDDAASAAAAKAAAAKPGGAQGAGPNSPLTPQRPTKKHQFGKVAGEVAGVAVASAGAAVLTGGTSLIPEAAMAGEMGLAAAARATGIAAGKTAAKGAARGVGNHLEKVALTKGIDLTGAHAVAGLLKGLRSVADAKAGSGVGVHPSVPGGSNAVPLNPTAEMSTHHINAVIKGAPGLASVAAPAPSSRGEVRAAMNALEALGNLSTALRDGKSLKGLGHLKPGTDLAGALGIGAVPLTGKPQSLAQRSAQHTNALGAFGAVQPMDPQALQRMNPQHRLNYQSGALDALPAGTLPRDAIYTVDPRTDLNGPTAMALRATGAHDPITGTIIPAGALTGVGVTTSTGDHVLGLTRSLSGRYVPDSQNNVPMAMLPSRVDGSVPVGVDARTWDSWRDLRGWMRENNLSPLNSDPSMWPLERRVQADQIAADLPQVYAALGAPQRPADMASAQVAGGLVSAGAAIGGPLDAAAMESQVRRLEPPAELDAPTAIPGPAPTLTPSRPSAPLAPMSLIPSPTQPPAQDTFDEDPLLTGPAAIAPLAPPLMPPTMPSSPLLAPDSFQEQAPMLEAPVSEPLSRKQRRRGARPEQAPMPVEAPVSPQWQEQEFTPTPLPAPERVYELDGGLDMSQTAPLSITPVLDPEPPRREAQAPLLRGLESSLRAPQVERSSAVDQNTLAAMSRLIQAHQGNTDLQQERQNLLEQALTDAADAISMQAEAWPQANLGQAQHWTSQAQQGFIETSPADFGRGPDSGSALGSGYEPLAHEDFGVPMSHDSQREPLRSSPREVAGWFDAIYEDQNPALSSTGDSVVYETSVREDRYEAQADSGLEREPSPEPEWLERMERLQSPLTPPRHARARRARGQVPSADTGPTSAAAPLAPNATRPPSTPKTPPAVGPDGAGPSR